MAGRVPGRSALTIGAVTQSIHDAIVDDLVRLRGVVMLVGGADTGKTSLAKRVMQEAVAAGRTVAFVDSDVGQTTVGPPACAALKWVREQSDLDNLAAADEMRFVGSVTPEGVVLQHVVATSALVDAARAEADLVLVDTTGAISGVVGQTLKYHKMELCQPDVVVAMQRGAEMEPLVGMLRRFFMGRVELTGVDPRIVPISPEDRRAHRTKSFAEAFHPELQRWRVRPTVFAPTLPAGLDMKRLDRMLVGLQDEAGRCRGLGALEFEDETLRVITNGGEEMRGLRLGSLRIDMDTFATERVRLKAVMFGLGD